MAGSGQAERSWQPGRRTGIALLLGVLLVVGYDVVALQLGAHTFFGASSSSVYNRLAESLSHGRLDLDVQVPRELLALPDPYDPQANQSFRAAGLHDLSLYHGKLYAYWGVVPAVLLYLPAHLAGLTLADGHVVLLFVLAGFLAEVALVALLVRRFLAPPPALAVVAGVLALGFATMGPFLLSRPVQYEVAIAAGDCFVWLAALCFVAAIWSRRRVALLALGSLCVGLAAGSRPTLLPAIVLGVPALRLALRGRPRAERVRAVAAFAAPLGVLLLLLAAYNQARFGSPAEFGTKWQLSNPQYRDGGYFTIRAVPPNLWNLLLPPPLVRAVFPFLYGNPDQSAPLIPGPLYGKDALVGIVWLGPFALLAALVPRWVRDAPPDLRRALAALALGLAVVLVPLLVIDGPTLRYYADFLPLLTALALVGWLVRLGRRRSGPLLAIGAALVLFGALVTALISLDNNSALRSYHRDALRTFEDVTGPVSALASGLAGHPILASVDDLPAGPPYRYDRLGRDGTTVTVKRSGIPVEIAASHAGRVRLDGRVRGGRLVVDGLLPGEREVRVRRGVSWVTLRPAGAEQVRVEGLRARWAD